MNTARKLLHHVREEYDIASKGEATTSANASSIVNFGPRRQVAAHKEELSFVLKENDSDDPDSIARTRLKMEAIFSTNPRPSHGKERQRSLTL